MTELSKTLIDGPDMSEIVLAQIALIVAEDQAEQQALAAAAAEPDPLQWKLRVGLELANPVEVFLSDPEDDLSPVVNVWLERITFDKSQGGVSNRQMATGSYILDVYAAGLTIELPAGAGQKPGDAEASFNAQRGARLVRNILRASHNTYLQLQGAVGMRWIRDITILRIDEGKKTLHDIVAARIALEVDFNEFAPQAIPSNILELSVEIRRAIDDLVIGGVEFDFN